MGAWRCGWGGGQQEGPTGETRGHSKHRGPGARGRAQWLPRESARTMHDCTSSPSVYWGGETAPEPPTRERKWAETALLGSLLTRLGLGVTSRGGTETAPGSGTQPSGAHERRPVRGAMGAGSTKRWALAVLGLVCLLPFGEWRLSPEPPQGLGSAGCVRGPTGPEPGGRGGMRGWGREATGSWVQDGTRMGRGRDAEKRASGTLSGRVVISSEVPLGAQAAAWALEGRDSTSFTPRTVSCLW